MLPASDLEPELLLREDGNDVLLPLRAKPGARRNAIEGIREGRLLVSVTAAPENGKANDALLQLLVKTLRVGKSTLSLEHGSTNRDKLVRIRTLSVDEVRVRLQAPTNPERK